MKLLVVEGALRENGGMRVMLALSDRWQRLGAEPSYFVLQKVTDESEQRPTVPLTYGQPTVGRLRWSLPRVFARLLKAGRGADVIVGASETGHGLLLAALAARLLHRPFVVVVQANLVQAINTWTPRRLRPLTFFVHRHVDAAVCVSTDLPPLVIANGLSQDRTHVILNGIDAQQIAVLAAQPSSVVLRPPVVAGVGRLSRQKGFDLLIRAHAELQRSGMGSQLVILGEGPERAALEQLVVSEQVADSVLLPGFVANPHAVVGHADLYCLSSRFEGLPLSLLEALATGTPVVATDCVSGPAEVLDGGRLGELVAPESAALLAAAIRRALLAPQTTEQRKERVERAREYDVDATARAYLAVFHRLLDPAAA